MNDDTNSKLRALVDKWRSTADDDAGDGWNVAHGACANELTAILDAEQPRGEVSEAEINAALAAGCAVMGTDLCDMDDTDRKAVRAAIQAAAQARQSQPGDKP